jgi:3-oxoacyl-[acyl-carrier protein] reductase
MSDRQAVITGGRGTLGSAIAGELRMAGWHVDDPGSADLDVRDENAVKRYFSQRAPELLICAAGITRDGPLKRMTEAAWNDVWSVNFNGARYCAEAVLPGMAARGGGHVVFISSHSAIAPPPGQTAYAAAKAALIGLTQDVARRYGRENIRVNTVLPGFLISNMTAAVTNERRQAVLCDHSLARFNTPREVAKFIRFLHEELPHTSGQVFQLDSRHA